MAESFAPFFRSAEPARDKYLSRLFGLVAEDVVRAWCACPAAAYEDLGRPTLTELGQVRGHTLDFTLRRRGSDVAYVAELKCELEYDGYRYLTLKDPDQLNHHAHSAAFAKLLRLATDPSNLIVRLRGQPIEPGGAILVWGAVSPEGRAAVMQEYRFADVLSVETMLEDLRSWSPDAWNDRIARYRKWTVELFDFIAKDISD